MTKATYLLDLRDLVDNSVELAPQQLISAAIFGVNKELLQTYNPEKEYKKGDRIPYITEHGDLIVIICIVDTTGTFNALHWEEYNVMNELTGLYNDYAVLSWNMPSLRRNKMWFEIKEESMEVAEGLGLSIGGDDGEGLLVYENFIISDRRPTLNRSTIWGEITDLSD
jgi:hypothetical protein